MHDFHTNDPIFTLCTTTPTSANVNTPSKDKKLCHSCKKTGGDDITCAFCGNKSCKDCAQKKRPFPGQPAITNSKEKLAKGVICKVCERRFQMNIFY